jgi:signal peptidase I
VTQTQPPAVPDEPPSPYDHVTEPYGTDPYSGPPPAGQGHAAGGHAGNGYVPSRHRSSELDDPDPTYPSRFRYEAFVRPDPATYEDFPTVEGDGRHRPYESGNGSGPAHSHRRRSHDLAEELAEQRRRDVHRDDGDEPERTPMPLWQELPLLLVVAFCVAVLIRSFLVQAFFIPSSSMEQALLIGDRVLVNKILYDVRQPERGEVVVFRGTDKWAPENFDEAPGGLFDRIGDTLGDLVGVSRPGEKDFIKRVIGLPGDHVACCDDLGRVTLNGVGIDEPYINANSPLDVPPTPGMCGSRRFAEVIVHRDQLFVMGDNRLVSQDSRCQGPVPIENVIGRAFMIVWPGDRWGVLNVPSSYGAVPFPTLMGPAPAGPLPDTTGAVVAFPVLLSLVGSFRPFRRRRWRARRLRG